MLICMTLLQLDIAFDDADAVQEGTLFAVVGRRGVEGRQSILKEKVRCAGQIHILLVIQFWKFVLSCVNYPQKYEVVSALNLRYTSNLREYTCRVSLSLWRVSLYDAFYVQFRTGLGPEWLSCTNVFWKGN